MPGLCPFGRSGREMDMSNGNNIFDGIDKALDVVDQAVKDRNYSDMSRQIKEIFEPYTKGFFNDPRQQSSRPYQGGHMDRHGNAFTGTYTKSGQRGYNGYPPVTGTVHPRPAPVQQPVLRRPARASAQSPYFKNAGILGSRFSFGSGLALAIISGAAFITSAVFTATHQFPFLGILGTVALGIATAGFAVMSLFGNKGAEQVKRYEKYRSVLEKDLYADIDVIVQKTGIPEKTVRKDLKKMTESGLFRQGHFDKKETCFIASDELYDQYLKTEEYAESVRKEKAAAEQAEKAAYGEVPDEVRELLQKGNGYIRRIQQANEVIDDVSVSEKLARMENIVTRIFEEVKKDNSLAGNLNMFMDYYLPTTDKLIRAYTDMDSQPLQGENIRKAKQEIEGTLDTINDAFENLLDSFFRERALDVTTDISVMKTIMRQEGLTPDDLAEIERRTKERKKMETGPTLEELSGQIREMEKVPAGTPLE